MGLFVDAGSPIAARALTLTTPTPGFTAAVYAANDVPDGHRGLDQGERRLTRVAEEQTHPAGHRAGRYRRYLLWITELPEGNKAAIQELNLLRCA